MSEDAHETPMKQDGIITFSKAVRSPAYFAVWGEGYAAAGGQHVSPRFFITDNGYTQEEIQEIKNLKIGEGWSPKTNEVHIVVRYR